MALAHATRFSSRPVIHEFNPSGSALCRCWEEGDGLTAVSDAVTCPECRCAQADPQACPSRSRRHRVRCSGQRGHGGLHHAEVYGVAHAWTDHQSPKLATDLLRVK